MPSALKPPRGGGLGYPGAGDGASMSRLYAAAYDFREGEMLHLDVVRSAERGALLSVAGSRLRIAPFRIDRWGQRYLSRGPIEIDAEALAPTLYRIIAVHDFRVEDRNPDLDECCAAVFLARRIAGRWEEAEDHPIECRSLAVLGQFDAAARRIAPE
ncbi:MAG: hypothetical protein ABI330_09445 [Caldimonas sp.]